MQNIIRQEPRKSGRFPDSYYDEHILQSTHTQAQTTLYEALKDVYTAHIIDLIEVRAISHEDAAASLQALVDSEIASPQPEHALAGFERGIAERANSNVLLGRAREDTLATAGRIVLRADLLDFANVLLDQRDALRDTAANHLRTLIVATSGGQSVQPTTLGHYFSGRLGSLARTLSRIEQTYDRVNLSPLGAGSGMSTAMPIRRERTAELLGFDGIVESTFDALASSDVELEVVSVLTLVAIETRKLVLDLEYWARDDVGIITPGDEYIHRNDDQPQRRDPRVLNYLRMRLAEHIAALNSLGMIASSETILGDDTVRLNRLLKIHDQITSVVETYTLLTGVVRSLIVERALSANITNRGFSTASELADLFAIDHQLPRDQAYSLAETIVTEALTMNINAMALTTDFIDRIALREVGVELGIEPETLSRCLAPRRFVERRVATGGPAPAAVRATLDRDALGTERRRSWLDDRRVALDSARATLAARQDELLSGRGSSSPSPSRQ